MIVGDMAQLVRQNSDLRVKRQGTKQNRIKEGIVSVIEQNEIAAVVTSSKQRSDLYRRFHRRTLLSQDHININIFQLRESGISNGRCSLEPWR